MFVECAPRCFKLDKNGDRTESLKWHNVGTRHARALGEAQSLDFNESGQWDEMCLVGLCKTKNKR